MCKSERNMPQFLYLHEGKRERNKNWALSTTFSSLTRENKRKTMKVMCHYPFTYTKLKKRKKNSLPPFSSLTGENKRKTMHVICHSLFTYTTEKETETKNEHFLPPFSSLTRGKQWTQHSTSSLNAGKNVLISQSSSTFRRGKLHSES